MTNKLSLSTETLRVLADEDLAGVVGAKKTGNGKCRRSRGRGKGCTK
jgi:hypothetical protein